MYLKRLTALMLFLLLLPLTVSCAKQKRFHFCSHCGSTEHSDEMCTKNTGDSSITRNFCSLCGDSSHPNQYCPFYTAPGTQSKGNTCKVCGAPMTAEHSHTMCPVCESTSHSIHPKCPICGKNDHIHGDCDLCEYCYSVEHTTENHPICFICGKFHAEIPESCPNVEYPYCSICRSTDHTNAVCPWKSSPTSAESGNNCSICGGNHMIEMHIVSCDICGGMMHIIEKCTVTGKSYDSTHGIQN